MEFLPIEEMRSVIYAYQLYEITEQDDTIVLMAIDSAVSEVKSYLNPNNQRKYNDGRPMYDVEKIFEATGTDRNALILEICKDIAVYRVCRLSNVDMLYQHVRERYKDAIDWLTKVAEGLVNPNLPVLSEDDDAENPRQAFRFGSRPKFNHE